MSPNRTRNWTNIPGPVALVVFVIGVAAIVGAVVLFLVRPGFKNDAAKVEASDAVPFAARLDRFDGDVGIARQTNAEGQPYQGWTKATVNAPLSLGDRIYVKDGSKAAIALSGRKYARLNSGTELDVVSLTPLRTQLAMREGACVFDLDALDSDEVFEVGTPNGAVDFTQPGLYQVGIDDTGDTVVSVLDGLARVAGLAGSGEVSRGQLITLAAADAAEAVVSELSPTTAGTIVDDYYSYRYPKSYDGRYADYQAYEDNPDYYEETDQRSVSHQYIADTEIAGVNDLDDYGDWEDVPNYGHCWRPRGTSADWAPYRDGYWSNDRTVGLTWVSNEQWGWAPYHYGRWAHVNQNWYWTPAEVVRHAVYAPALVAFVSSPRPDEIGWVPLGPGDPYVPRYYDRDYQPHYIGSRRSIEEYTNVTKTAYYGDPAAVTVVSVSQFTRVITPATVLRTDPAYMASARHVVEPFAVPVLRQLAPTMEASKPVVAVPVEVHQLLERPVVLRQQPAPSPVAGNVGDTLKVQPIPEDRAKRKLQLKNSGEAVVATQPNGLPAVSPAAKVGQMSDQERQARIAALAAQAAQGNKGAKREMRQLEEQQRQQAAQQAVTQQQQQAEQRKAERQAERQQALQAEQQRQAQAAQLMEQQKAQKRVAREQAVQAEQQRQAQAAQQAEQRKAQRQAERQQAQPGQQPEVQRQAQAAQQAEQRKAERQAARQQAQQAEQQRQAQAAQAGQLAEQRKAQKQAAQQQALQAEQQRQAQAAQQAEQRKAERQAVRQQAEQQRQAQAGQQAGQQAEQRKAQQRAAEQQAQQEAARQQALREQRKVQRQAEQQAQDQGQQQRQQQKDEKRAQRQNAEQQPAQPQANPGKAEKKAERAKNKNKNANP